LATLGDNAAAVGHLHPMVASVRDELAAISAQIVNRVSPDAIQLQITSIWTNQQETICLPSALVADLQFRMTIIRNGLPASSRSDIQGTGSWSPKITLKGVESLRAGVRNRLFLGGWGLIKYANPASRSSF
jgi:hypothetical protein